MDKLYTDWSLKNLVGEYGSMDFTVNPAGPLYQESIFTFSEPQVISGSVTTHVSPNIDVSLINMDLQQNVVFDINDGIERAGSSFLLKGNIQTESIYDSRHRRIGHSNHMFVYSQNRQNSYTMAAGQTAILYLNLKPAFLNQIIQSDERIGNLLGKNPPAEYCIGAQLNASPSSGYNETLSAILNNKFSGLTKHLYLEAKALELFSMELEEMLNVKDIAADMGKLSLHDREKLHALHAYLCANFAEPLSFSNLALQFGLNEFKLKKGYKQLFDNTVFGHIYQLRMQEAKRLLLTGAYNVSETAYMVGYNNPYNFSTAFCRMFGYPPSSVWKKAA